MAVEMVEKMSKTRRELRIFVDRGSGTILMPAPHTRPMWLALNAKNQTRAMWFRGCAQEFNSWRRAIKRLGYHPVKVTVVFPW